MSSQWTSIDGLRLNKYMLLVRRVVAAHIRWAKSSAWSDLVVDVLRVGALAGHDEEEEEEEEQQQGGGFVHLGIRLHVLDVLVDELDREGALLQLGAAADGQRRRFVERFVSLLKALSKEAMCSVRKKAVAALTDERLASFVDETSEAVLMEEGTKEKEEEAWGGFDD
ncbi:hypothetical protein XA68_11676 [Ophiocordyceps unilateralis]|uniref:Uncharacterized protein n=1 Tax=Ophiocordyceps unilateralis TaxID=268505 RepID=A0A2A9PGC3_OPHUN|nr:hypothetical protein XA68_11676 [Ophiocordyceps unilateralis]